MILRRLILPPRLDTVMAMAQGLPVAPVPEELLITTVRNDVIHVRRLNVPAFPHTLHTQRVRLKVLLPGFLPRTAVASARCGTYFFWMHRFVSVAILLS